MLKCNTFYINKHKCVAIANGGRINKFSTHRGQKNLSINVTFTGWSACSAKLESSLGGNDMLHCLTLLPNLYHLSLLLLFSH